jgi:hypothetical protein
MRFATIFLCIAIVSATMPKLYGQGRTARAINQSAWRQDMFSDLGREFYNIPFLTWKRVNNLTTSLTHQDAGFKIRRILRSFEEESLAFFQFAFTRSLQKMPVQNHRRYIRLSLAHVDTQRSLFTILCDPVARFLKRNKPYKYEEFRNFELAIQKQFEAKRAFFQKLLGQEDS